METPTSSSFTYNPVTPFLHLVWTWEFYPTRPHSCYDSGYGIQSVGTEPSFQASLQRPRSDVAYGRGIGREREHGCRHL